MLCRRPLRNYQPLYSHHETPLLKNRHPNSHIDHRMTKNTKLWCNTHGDKKCPSGGRRRWPSAGGSRRQPAGGGGRPGPARAWRSAPPPLYEDGRTDGRRRRRWMVPASPNEKFPKISPLVFCGKSQGKIFFVQKIFFVRTKKLLHLLAPQLVAFR